MFTRVISVPLLAGLSLLMAVPLLAPAQVPADKAVIVVKLPEDAKLTIEGDATKATGAERRFVTPPLREGVTYSYVFAATWKVEGKEQKAEKKVTFKAGQTVQVEFPRIPPVVKDKDKDKDKDKGKDKEKGKDKDKKKDKGKGKDKEDGFVSIFDGKSLKGWKISAESGHSRTSKNKSGGKWYVDEKEKAIYGTQDVPGNGGILITEEEYGDFEVRLEMRNDFGPDSGLFLRSNMKGQAYQAMIDYHKGGNLMGVYGEGIGGFHFRNFTFGDKVTEITEEKQKSNKFPLPIAPEKWAEFWKHGEWNELAARIEGNPPKVTTWIKGVKFMEFTGDKKLLPDKGGIALQVHGGGDLTKQLVRYRNVRVKKLDKK